jgi:hypothetical protein
MCQVFDRTAADAKGEEGCCIDGATYVGRANTSYKQAAIISVLPIRYQYSRHNSVNHTPQQPVVQYHPATSHSVCLPTHRLHMPYCDVTVWSLSCSTCSGTSPLVRRCCLSCTSAVYSPSSIPTVRSFTRYNLSSILNSLRTSCTHRDT